MEELLVALALDGRADRAGENPVEKLLEWTREDVLDLAREGLFEALQAISDRRQ